MANDRLIPDFFRSLKNNAAIVVRNPLSVRPWQHILEPISGYMMLAERIAQPNAKNYVGSWNFGPIGNPISVEEVIKKLLGFAGVQNFVIDTNVGPKETNLLTLDSAQARARLGWMPRLSVEQALEWTYDWFVSSEKKVNMLDFSVKQICDFEELS